MKARSGTSREERLGHLAHGELLLNLESKVRPEHTALLIIDVQNDFCAAGGMMHSEGLDVTDVQSMIPTLLLTVKCAREAGVLPIFVRNVYSTPANSYLSDSWLEQAYRRRGSSYIDREVCEPAGWNGAFYGGVEPNPTEPIVTKHRYCAFTNTDLDLILRSHNVRTVVLTGVATNVCVETTARSAFVRDYYVVILRDAVATYAPEDQEHSLKTLDRYFAEVTTADQVQGIWND